MLLDENKTNEIEINVKENVKKTSIKENKKVKKYKALKTIKVLCNTEFQLVEGEEIPEGIHEAFIDSLINSNIIK